VSRRAQGLIGAVPLTSRPLLIEPTVTVTVYGEDKIASEKPFKVILNGDVWTVTGKDLPPGTLGGVAEADISKRDGRILRVIHGQ
jgi:hypothetical protein